jgi:hypothetical protein
VRRQAGSPTLQQGSNDSPPRLQVDFFGVPKTMRLPNVGDVCVPDNWLEQIRSGTRLAFLVLEKQWELLGWKLNSLKLHIGIDQDGCLRLTGPFDADSWQLSKIEGSPARRIPNDKSLGKAATRHRRTALLTQEFCKQRPTVLHVDCGPKQLTSNTGFRQEFKPPSLWGLGIEDRLLHVTKLERGNGSHGFWQERHFPLYISAPPRDLITIEDNFQMVVLYGERCFETAKLLSQSTTMPIIVVPDRDMAIERVGPSVTILTSMEAVVWHVARVLSASWPSVYAKTNLESSGGARE